MANYGIKVTKAGYAVGTATANQLVFSSKYNTLRVKSQGTGSLTHGSRSVTIAHNLGYVPAFLVHSQLDPLFASFYGSATDYFVSPFSYPAGGCNVDRNLISWADSTNLYIEVGSDFGVTHQDTGCGQYNYATNSSTSGYFSGVCREGHDTATWGNLDGALRFDGINLNKDESFYSATLKLYIQYRAGSGDVKLDLYGIDEDDTADFSSDPFGRTKTTAKYDLTIGGGYTAGTTYSYDMSGIVEEIIARASWSNGNALGIFLMRDSANENDNNIRDHYSDGCPNPIYGCSASWLEIIKSNTITNYKYTIYYNKVE